MVLQPKFFRALDGMVAAVSETGLVAALVVLWSNQSGDPGQSLSEEDRFLLARYIVARYGAYPVVWFLGGDGDYRGEKAEFWKTLGREVLMGGENRLSGMHPCGLITVADEFRQEPWFHFVGFQSGHGDGSDTVRWLVEGPPAQEWKSSPARPVLDLEPRYEGHLSYQGRTPWDARGVRNGLYWNLLNSPTAGVTYGHHGIWPWCEKRETPLNHEGSGEAPPWYEAMESPGALSILPLRRIMEEARWTELFPCPELLAEQPGREDPTRFIAAAATSDWGNALVYLPQGGAVQLKPGILASDCQGRWIHPDSGKAGEPFTLEGGETEVTAPDEKGDWILLLKDGAR